MNIYPGPGGGIRQIIGKEKMNISTFNMSAVDFDGNEALSVSKAIANNDHLNINDLGKTTEFLRSGINSLVNWLK